MQCAVRYIGEDLDDLLCHAGQGPNMVSNKAKDDLSHSLGIENVEATMLPLPSYMGGEYVDAHRVRGITDMELELRLGQANNVLHELQLALHQAKWDLPFIKKSQIAIKTKTIWETLAVL